MRELLIHEIRQNLASGKLAAAFILLAVCFLISLGMMQQEYLARQENFNESISLSGQDYFYGRLFLWAYEGGGYSADDTYTAPLGRVSPPSRLLYFCRGTDMEMRQSVEFANRIPIVETTAMPQQDPNLLKLVFQAPDLLFVVKVLVSLTAILFTYNTITEERESGTLKLLLANNASRTSIFFGKYFGNLISLAAAFTLALLIYLLSLSALNQSVLSGEAPARIALLYATSLLYMAVFLGIGFVVSSFSQRSGFSLVFSLFTWLLLVFALPGLATVCAEQLVSVESNNMVERMKLEKAQAMEREYERSHPGTADGHISGYGGRHDEIRGEINAELAKIDDAHQRNQELRAELTIDFSRVTPVGSLTYLFSTLSHTGIADVKLYRREIIRLRERVDDDLTAMFTNPAMGEWFQPTQFDLHPEVVSRVKGMMDLSVKTPFETLSLGASLDSAWIDFLILFAFAVIPLVVSYVKFLIYDPR
jgi:ABC-type transport system involved in multi-copper enzyme maturation permease subunit